MNEAPYHVRDDNQRFLDLMDILDWISSTDSLYSNINLHHLRHSFSFERQQLHYFLPKKLLSLDYVSILIRI